MEFCGPHRPDATSPRILACRFRADAANVPARLNDRLYRPSAPLGLWLQHDVDAALGDAGVAGAGLADRHLAQHCRAQAVLRKLVGDDLAAGLREPLVRERRAR